MLLTSDQNGDNGVVAVIGTRTMNELSCSVAYMLNTGLENYKVETVHLLVFYSIFLCAVTKQLMGCSVMFRLM